MANDSSHAGEAIRRHLVEALRADAIGPHGGREALETSTELLPYAPSRWYLTGFLAPSASRDVEDVEAEDDLASGPAS